MRKIALCGLALSHPWTFADIMLETAEVELHVWDSSIDRVRAFVDGHPGAVVHEDFDSLLRVRPDGAMVCTESSLHHTYAIACLEAAVPTFIDKCMVVSRSALAELVDAEERTRTPVFSSSILRYSPDFAAQAKRTHALPRHERLLAQATVYHSIEGYLKPGNEWQDIPEIGGGTLVNMGVHGLELLLLNAGPGVKRVFAAADRRYFTASQSEDVAVIQAQYADGMIGTVRVVGSTILHGYQMEVVSRAGLDSVFIPNDQSRDLLEQYGYRGCVQNFLGMVEGASTSASFADAVHICSVLLAARDSVRTGSWAEVP
ncbi:Gfo/Idh/MocA family protein [Alicyclobacillus acidiphilus]|uniref:Gfo/Idh/MocA family protein n=1 Tax=Alicyclobacillus acidiphilus TaxID=182455 RepID=UPI00147004A8|nr:Gfo/Idh/MocA family oxidoreductase [Alicyclobacillus acidiphilus]